VAVNRLDRYVKRRRNSHLVQNWDGDFRVVAVAVIERDNHWAALQSLLATHKFESVIECDRIEVSC
jgi:hypothetical protein